MYEASGKLDTEDIAIEGENWHFRRPHSHLTPPHQRSPTNIGVSLISPETVTREIRSSFYHTSVLIRRFGKESAIQIGKSCCLCFYDAALWKFYKTTVINKLKSTFTSSRFMFMKMFKSSVVLMSLLHICVFQTSSALLISYILFMPFHFFIF